MGKSKFTGYCTVFLTILYNFFFWKESLGLNLVLFVALILITIIITSGLENKNAKLAGIALLCSGACVLIINSWVSIFALMISVIFLAGFSYSKELKTLIGALLMIMTSYFLYPVHLLIEIVESRQKSRFFAASWRFSKLFILPLIVFVVFYSIYAFSNPTFNSYSVQFWSCVREQLGFILDYYPPVRFIFIFFGFVLISGILFNSHVRIFERIESKFGNSLFRSNEKKLHSSEFDLKKLLRKNFPNLFSFRLHSLKTEYRIGLVLMIMVNILLLILNVIDINFVWINFSPSEVDNLAYFVHEGTYYLIFSIILSSLIILYYFRGNLNFYSKNKMLKYTAYFWLFQNGILAVSLALRNYYYIDFYYALSYKRIGVMVFLILTFSGLISMLIKLMFKKSLFFLVKFNSWVFFIALLISASVNWDYQVARFNLQNPQKEKIDYGYLFTLSDDVLPLLYNDREYLDKEIILFPEGRIRTDINGFELLNRRIALFIEKYKSHTFLSWNYADSETYMVLKEINYKN